MTNLDELIRRADPTRYTEGPRPGSPEAERIWVRVTLMPPAARRGSRRPLLLSVGLVAMALVVVSVVALQIGPGPVSRSVSPAAAALHRIAAAADDQPPVTLSGDQFLESDYQASVLASQSQIGSTTITGAQATIGVTITQFADLLSTSCIHVSFSVPTFASAAAQTAWTTAGLLLAPSPATTGSCEVDAGDPTQSRGGAGAINVSGLPGDPATLARDLERGTTGITRIDDPVGADTDVAFERAVLLLVEPVVGATPQFWSALYGAMSMIPGVNLLGTETTHSGRVVSLSVVRMDPALPARQTPSSCSRPRLGHSWRLATSISTRSSRFTTISTPRSFPLPNSRRAGAVQRCWNGSILWDHPTR